MDVVFYKFNKRENSTKKPDGGVVYDVVLKDDCSIINPVIKMSTSPITDTVYTYNYCYIEVFKRYYFIMNWEFIDRLWVANMTVDVLASQRTAILTSQQYVQRSSSQYDNNFNDATYPPVLEPLHAYTNLTSPFVEFSNSNGCYIVGIIGSGSVSSGSVSYYYFTPSGLTAFNNVLLGSTDYMQLTDSSQIEATTAKLITNPFQYISSCMWYPFTMDISTSAQSVKLGWWTIDNVVCQPLSAPWQGMSLDAAIIKHPNQDSRGTWLNYSPWTSIRVIFEPFGVFDVPADMMAKYDTWRFIVKVDCITGQAVLVFGAASSSSTAALSYIASETSAQLGVEIPLAQSSGGEAAPAALGVSSAISGLATTGQELASRGGWLSELGGSVLAGLANVGSALTQAASSVMGSLFGGILNGTSLTTQATILQNGSQGSFAGTFLKPSIEYTFLTPAEENLAEWGRPLNAMRLLGNLTGFCKCVSPDFTGSDCTMTETIAVNNYLERGVFLE